MRIKLSICDYVQWHDFFLEATQADIDACVPSPKVSFHVHGTQVADRISYWENVTGKKFPVGHAVIWNTVES